MTPSSALALAHLTAGGATPLPASAPRPARPGPSSVALPSVPAAARRLALAAPPRAFFSSSPHPPRNPRMDFVEEREDEIRDRKVVTWEVVDYDEAPCDEEFIPPDNDSLYCEDIRKSWLLSWMAEMRSLSDDEDDVDPPPLFILDYPDIFEEGWGWRRLLPYSEDGSVAWPVFKGYLKDYFNHNTNAVAAFCAHHMPEAVGQSVSAGRNDLRAAALLCLEIEDKILQGFSSRLSTDEITLSCDIKKRAEHIIQSGEPSATVVGCESSADTLVPSTATAGLVCIVREGELICELLKCDFDTTEMVAFSNHIRQSALNLMLNGSLESAGAMVGMAEEAKVQQQLIVVDPQKYLDSLLWDTIREATATVLTILEQELSCKTTATCDGNDTSAGSKSEIHMGKDTCESIGKEKWKTSSEEDSNDKKRRKFNHSENNAESPKDMNLDGAFADLQNPVLQK